MLVKILVDNNTLIDRYLVGEPGISIYIEEGGKKIIFDVGYSSAFLSNGVRLGVDFCDIDYVAISHSHLDHTWGLEPYIKYLSEEVFEGRTYKRPLLVGHTDIFASKTFTGEDEFGINVDRKKLSRYFTEKLTKEPLWITENLVFLGEIPRENNFECLNSIGKINIDGAWVEDFNLDDSALCYKGKDGLVIITGCSHSGICNITEYAKKICDDHRVLDIIGGLHLQNPPSKQLNATINYLNEQTFKSIHACHCTDLKSKIAISKYVDVLEVGSGTVLKYE